MSGTEFISKEVFTVIGVGVVCIFLVISREFFNEVGKRIVTKVFGLQTKEEVQRKREDELHELLVRVIERNTCGSHPQVMTILGKIEKRLEEGDGNFQRVEGHMLKTNKHMERTNRCVWMIGKHLKIEDDFPEEA